MKKITILKTFLLMLFMISCDSNEISLNTENHFITNNYNPDVIAKNKIKVRECVEIISNVDEKLNKIESEYDVDIKKVIEKHFFDENGYCYLKVKPRYLSYEVDTTGFSKISDPIEKFNAFIPKESPVHSGLNDSTYYFFDDKKRLLEEIESTPKSAKRQWRTSVKFKYDNNNNLIERCVDSKDFPINCYYFKYKFNSSDNSVVVYDSCFFSYDNEPRKSQTLASYDKNKKVNFDGGYFYEFDKNNRLKKSYDKYADNKTEFNEYTYNEEGNLIFIQENRENSRHTIRFQYDENKLLIQKIITDEYYNSKDKKVKKSNKKIFKYEYK